MPAYLAEVHIHYVGSTVITKLLRHAHFVGILKEVDHHLASRNYKQNELFQKMEILVINRHCGTCI